jgi:LacI family transcriptional regulator
MGIEAFNLLLEEMNCHKKVNHSARTIELETNIIIEIICKI